MQGTVAQLMQCNTICFFHCWWWWQHAY